MKFLLKSQSHTWVATVSMKINKHTEATNAGCAHNLIPSPQFSEASTNCAVHSYDRIYHVKSSRRDKNHPSPEMQCAESTTQLHRQFCT